MLSLKLRKLFSVGAIACFALATVGCSEKKEEKSGNPSSVADSSIPDDSLEHAQAECRSPVKFDRTDLPKAITLLEVFLKEGGTYQLKSIKTQIAIQNGGEKIQSASISKEHEIEHSVFKDQAGNDHHRYRFSVSNYCSYKAKDNSTFILDMINSTAIIPVRINSMGGKIITAALYKPRNYFGLDLYFEATDFSGNMVADRTLSVDGTSVELDLNEFYLLPNGGFINALRTTQIKSENKITVMEYELEYEFVAAEAEQN